MAINRDRLRRAFVDLGAALPEEEPRGLSDELLAQLIEIKVEDLGANLTQTPEASARLQRAAGDFSAVARRTLGYWGKTNTAAFALGQCADDLSRDDGAYVVLLILRAKTDAEGFVIADSRWRDHFRDSTATRFLNRLVQALRSNRPLLSYCGVGHPGALPGKLEESIHADATRAWKSEEVEFEIPDREPVERLTLEDGSEDEADLDEDEIDDTDDDVDEDDDGSDDDDDDRSPPPRSQASRPAPRAPTKRPSAYISPAAARYRRR
jgi:hypothetical protein